MERAGCFFCCDYRRRYSCSNHYEEEVIALPSQSKRLLNFLFFEDYRHRSPFHPYCSLPRKKSQHRPCDLTEAPAANLDRFFYRCVSTTYCGGVMFKEHYPAFAVVQVEQQPKKRKRTAYKNCGFHKASNEFVYTNSLARENPLTPAPKKAATRPPLFGSFWGQKEQSLALNKAVVQVEQ